MKTSFFMSPRLLILSMICILFSGPGVIADTVKPIPDTLPLDQQMKVTGSFIVGISGAPQPSMHGKVILRMKGKPYSGALVLLGGVKLAETGGSGYYTIDNPVPVSHQTLTLSITYPSVFPGKSHTITIEGIAAGPGIRFTNPSKNTFYPFGATKFKAAWNGTFGRQTFYINNTTDGNNVLAPCSPRGNSWEVNSSLFQSGKTYKFYFHGKKYLKINGPAAPGSEFYTGMTATRRSTCMGLIIK